MRETTSVCPKLNFNMLLRLGLTVCCEFLDHLKLKNKMTVTADFHDG